MRRGAITSYVPHLHAKPMHNSTAKETLVVSPVRAGKTRSLIHDVIVKSWNNETAFAGLVIAPTFRDLKALVEQPIVEKLHELGLLKSHNWQDHETRLKNGKRIYYRSAEEPKSIEGLNVFAAWCDEFANCKKEAIDNVRNRLLLTNGQFKLFGTPKGTGNWAFAEFFGIDSAIGLPLVTGAGSWDVRNNRLVRYSIFDNPFITQAAVDDIASRLDPLRFRQDVLGEWVNLSEHRVYYAFDDANVKPCSYQKGFPIYIGLDYNIGKNAWVAFQQLKAGELSIFAEGFGALTTQALAAELIGKFGNQITIIDDASGNVRQQGDGRTNRQLLQQAGLHNITEYTRNPNRVDRYANTNAHFYNGLGNRRMFIDPSCKRLISELHTLCYRKGSDEPDSLNGEAGHITDALGYGVWWISGGLAAWDIKAA